MMAARQVIDAPNVGIRWPIDGKRLAIGVQTADLGGARREIEMYLAACAPKRGEPPVANVVALLGHATVGKMTSEFHKYLIKGLEVERHYDKEFAPKRGASVVTVFEALPGGDMADGGEGGHADVVNLAKKKVVGLKWVACDDSSETERDRRDRRDHEAGRVGDFRKWVVAKAPEALADAVTGDGVAAFKKKLGADELWFTGQELGTIDGLTPDTVVQATEPNGAPIADKYFKPDREKGITAGFDRWDDYWLAQGQEEAVTELKKQLGRRVLSGKNDPQVELDLAPELGVRQTDDGYQTIKLRLTHVVEATDEAGNGLAKFFRPSGDTGVSVE